MKNNIIGQLGGLAFALIGGILDIINTMRKDLQNKIMGNDLDEEKRLIQKK